MSKVSTYVRARNGALYKNPIFAFDEGFVCFDDEEPPELVLWKPKEGDPITPAAALELVLGARVDGEPPEWRLVRGARESQRVVPFTSPPQFLPAIAYFFELFARVPTPTFHEGEERYASRIRGHVLDFSARASDPNRLEVIPPFNPLG